MYDPDELHYYESQNVGHVFSSRVNFAEDVFQKMRDPNSNHINQGEKDEECGPDFVNIHTGKFETDPVEWIKTDGMEFPSDVYFFFCIKHANGGKIQSH